MVGTLSCYMYSTSKQAKANNIDLQYEPATEHINTNPCFYKISIFHVVLASSGRTMMSQQP